MRILSVDLGDARTGLAVCDAGERLASPVGTLFQRDREKLLSQVAEAVREQRAELVVVGHPRNMDGTRGESARKAEAFAERLRQETGLTVELWDERLTTASGHRLSQPYRHPGTEAEKRGGYRFRCHHPGGLPVPPPQTEGANALTQAV